VDNFTSDAEHKDPFFSPQLLGETDRSLLWNKNEYGYIHFDAH
jgi:hypothetical protein